MHDFVTASSQRIRNDDRPVGYVALIPVQHQIQSCLIGVKIFDQCLTHAARESIPMMIDADVFFVQFHRRHLVDFVFRDDRFSTDVAELKSLCVDQLLVRAYGFTYALNTTVDQLIADNLTGSQYNCDAELYRLFSGCPAYERRIILEIATAARYILEEYRWIIDLDKS